MSGDSAGGGAPMDRAPDEAEALVDLPPEKWMEARRRYAVLTEYMKIHRPTGDDVRRAARRLNISTKTFGRLIAARTALLDGKRKPSSRRGLHSTVAPETAAIIRQVIDDLGPNATNMAVHAEAGRRAADAGLPVPSTNAIRSRRGRTAVPVDLRVRLRLECDEVVDCCPLNFDVTDGEDAPRPAVFAALLAASDGGLLAWGLHAGSPSQEQLLDMLRGARDDHPLHERVLAATRSAHRLLAGDEEALAEAGYHLAEIRSVRLRSGAAIVPSLGRTIGRAPFAPLRRLDKPAPDMVVPLELARSVAERELGPSATARNDREGPSAAAKPASRAAFLAELRTQVRDVIVRATGADRDAAGRAAREICESVGPLVSAANQALLLLQAALPTALPPAPGGSIHQPAEP